jgi:hypothetical protein
MCVRLTHYTLKGIFLKPWVFESSLDFVNWTEMDRTTNNEDFKDWVMASFAVSKSAECRFIRLTQTSKNDCGDDCLIIQAFEFFRTLLE